MSLLAAGYMPHIPMPTAPPRPPQPRRKPGRPRVDMRGVHGQLEALELAEPSPNGEVRWRCRCLACGSITVVRRSNLQRRDGYRPMTCGCIQRVSRPWWWE